MKAKSSFQCGQRDSNEIGNASNIAGHSGNRGNANRPADNCCRRAVRVGDEGFELSPFSSSFYVAADADGALGGALTGEAAVLALLEDAADSDPGILDLVLEWPVLTRLQKSEFLALLRSADISPTTGLASANARQGGRHAPTD